MNKTTPVMQITVTFRVVRLRVSLKSFFDNSWNSVRRVVSITVVVVVVVIVVVAAVAVAAVDVEKQRHQP